MRRRIPLLQRWKSQLVRFGRDESGVTLIEFGILAIPFFTIIGAILETAMIFLAGQMLDSAVHDTARLIRTGQVQALDWDGDDYREALCDRLYGLFDCTPGISGRLRINVATIDNFTESAIGYPLSIGDECTDDECDWVLADDYVPGSGGNVVLVQAYYKWPTILNMPGFNFGTLPDGSRLLGASRVFRNEPFGCNDCT